MWYVMSYKTSLTINAAAERVWSELIDVERWPLSTTSMTSVERLDDGPFQVGSSARIKQPKVPTMVWTVTDFQPRREFTWVNRSPGVTTIAGHVIAPGPGDSVTVTLSITRTGPLAPLVDRLTGKLTRDYVDLEIAGLKRVCEAGAVATAA
jgi:uncharacterized membrane protein